MRIYFKLATVFCALLLTSCSLAQTKKAKEYLGVPGPISINKNAYKLAWSSHTSDNYYVQEYLTAGDSLKNFKSMVIIQVLTGTTSPKDAASAKITELDNLKKSNPVVNYNAFQKDGEVMLDFLLSENTSSGSISILERNVYRYKSVTDKSGKKCLLLFAVSERAYGNDADQFLKDLKSKKQDLVNSVAGYKMPAITLTK